MTGGSTGGILTPERGPFGRAGMSVWDPLANVLTAAYTVARGGWSQWECKP